MSTKILLADDHKIVRDGLRSLIEKQPGMAVVAEAENGRAAVKLARRLKPGVIIMDLNMPDLNGIDAARQIVAELPGTKIIVLSMHADKQFVVGALQAGASGYLLKDCAFEELARALQTVLKHQTYLSPEIAGTVVKDYLEPKGARPKRPPPGSTSASRPSSPTAATSWKSSIFTARPNSPNTPSAKA